MTSVKEAHQRNRQGACRRCKVYEHILWFSVWGVDSWLLISLLCFEMCIHSFLCIRLIMIKGNTLKSNKRTSFLQNLPNLSMHRLTNLNHLNDSKPYSKLFENLFFKTDFPICVSL